MSDSITHPARLIIRRERVANSEVEGIKLSKLASKVTCIVRRYSTFVHFMKTILNFSTALDKVYNGKFVKVRIVNVTKNVICFEFLTGMNALSDYRDSCIAKMVLTNESALSLVEGPNADDARSESLRVSHSKDIELYRATTEGLPILI